MMVESPRASSLRWQIVDPGGADAPEGYINNVREGNYFMASGHLTFVCSRMSHFKLHKFSLMMKDYPLYF